jgi:hypothetical protein
LRIRQAVRFLFGISPPQQLVNTNVSIWSGISKRRCRYRCATAKHVDGCEAAGRREPQARREAERVLVSPPIFAPLVAENSSTFSVQINLIRRKAFAEIKGAQ